MGVGLVVVDVDFVSVEVGEGRRTALATPLGLIWNMLYPPVVPLRPETNTVLPAEPDPDPESTTISTGLLMVAAVAGRPSPENPLTPVPSPAPW